MNSKRYLCALLTFAALAYGQDGPPPIQDNSFLIEEAYNQEWGVVQHVSTFSRMWNSKDWSYTFTQEWPGLRNWRHQFSYTLAGLHAGRLPGSGGGFGDLLLNYRYQAIGSGRRSVAVAPRVSAMIPTGSVERGRGSGGAGVQVNLPASIVAHRRLVTHWNAGGTYLPRAHNAEGARASTVGYNLGQSFAALAHPRLNFLLETYMGGFQTVAGRGTTAWNRTVYTSPGVRFAFNHRSGLQIVPGVAIPFGIGPSAGERGVFLYLSLEHAFRPGVER